VVTASFRVGGKHLKRSVYLGPVKSMTKKERDAAFRKALPRLFKKVEEAGGPKQRQKAGARGGKKV